MGNKQHSRYLSSVFDFLKPRDGLKQLEKYLLEHPEKIHLVAHRLANETVHAQAQIAIDEKGINKEILDKELEIIKEELKNSGKKSEMIEKISKGKIKKFISDNTLLDQIWIMDTKKKVSQIIKEYSDGSEIKVLDFVRYKVGEGID